MSAVCYHGVRGCGVAGVRENQRGVRMCVVCAYIDFQSLFEMSLFEVK